LAFADFFETNDQISTINSNRGPKFFCWRYIRMRQRLDGHPEESLSGIRLSIR
jgi:hypothetical protein